MSGSRRPTFEERTEIEELLLEYAHRIDTGDLVGFAELFRHGRWIGRRGVDETLDWLRHNVVLHDGDTRVQHLVSNVVVRVEESGDRASARSCIAVVQQPPGKPFRTVRVNTYADTFERVDGAWRFATRSVERELVGDDSDHLHPHSPQRKAPVTP